MLLDPPRTLPVNLSVSSISMLRKCPLRWKKRYIDGLWESASGALVTGRAVGQAEGRNYQQKIDTRTDLPLSDVLDTYSDEFDYAREELQDKGGVDWEDERPGKVKDTGARVLGLYHQVVAPRIRPRSVEREFTIHLPDVDWTFRGYFDLEDRHGVNDLKARGPSRGIVSSEEAAGDLQATAYLFARRVEGNPAQAFRFHNLVRAEQPGPKHIVLTPTQRTDQQLDAFVDELYQAAAEIHWRLENDVWTGPPSGVWWCSQRWCGFWADCPLGGGLRPATPLLRPKPIVAPTREQVLAAVASTVMKRSGKTAAAGHTTAARVAQHLGISTRSAAGYLANAHRDGTLRAVPGSEPRQYAPLPADQAAAA